MKEPKQGMVPGTARRSGGRGVETRHYPVEGATARDVEIVRSAPVEKDGPRLRVAPPAPVTTPRAPFVLLVLVLVVGGVLGILVLNTKINENAFQLHDLRDQQAALDVDEQQLVREIAQKEAPNNLAAASIQYGMVPSNQPAYLKLPDGRLIGMPQPGQPGQKPAG